MRKPRTVVSALLAGTVLIVTAACSGSSTTSASSAAGSSSASSAASAAGAGASSPGASSPGASSQSGSSSQSSPAAAGKQNASMTIVANSLPTGLDPDTTNSTDSGISQIVTMNYMGMLYSYNGIKTDGNTIPKIQPDLATGATASADGLTWTFKLRTGVKSVAGNPLTAADVVWTLKRSVAAKATGASLMGQANISLTNPATAVDANTVAIHLTNPSALVTTILALPYLGIIDSVEAAKHVTAADPYATKWLGTNVASFGPYTVSSLSTGTIVLAANPNYWQGTPSVTKATFRTVQDAGTSLQTALTGQSDMTLSLAASDLKVLKASPMVDVHELPVPSVVYMSLDQKNASVSNAKVRQAVALATDRTAIVNTVYNGAATPTTGCLPTDLTTATTPNDNAATPQADKAKALLAQVPGPHTLTIGTLPSAFPEGATIARIIQANLQAVGFTVTIKTYSSFGPITADIKNHVLSSIILEQAPFVVDAGYFFKAFFLGSAPYNFSSYSNPAFDAAANAAMTEPAATRGAEIAKACAIFAADAPADMLVQSGNISVTKKNITNVQPFPDISPRLFNLKVTS